MSTRLYIGCILFLTILLCSNIDKTVGPIDSPETGTLRVSVHTSPVGALAKLKNIELAFMNIQLSSPGLTTIYDTLLLSGGNFERSEQAIYSDIPARIRNEIIEWTLTVESRDQNDMVIHSGDTVFSVPFRDTIDIEMFIAAQYSMLKANFYPIRDSVTGCVLITDGEIVGESYFAKQSILGDTVILNYDYLQASPTGVSHDITMNVYGDFWGIDTLLYTGDTTITISSGQNDNYHIKLKNVTPGVLNGAASMMVTLGEVGEVVMDGNLMPKVEEFIEEFDDPVLSSDWVVEEFQGTRTNNYTSPAGHYSLTDRAGFLRYIVDPMTTAVGYWNEFNKALSYYWYDPSLEIRRTFEGTHWKLEVKLIAYLPQTNGRGSAIDVIFGDGTTGSICFTTNIGRDLGDPGASSGVSHVVGPYNTENGNPQMETLQSPSPFSFPNGVGDVDTVYFELRRSGTILQSRISIGEDDWHDLVYYDAGPQLYDLSQKIRITGSSWFNSNGTYFDYDYVKLTQN